MKQFAARSELVEYLRAPSDHQKRIAGEACLHGLEDGFVDAVLADEPHYEIECLAVTSYRQCVVMFTVLVQGTWSW